MISDLPKQTTPSKTYFTMQKYRAIEISKPGIYLIIWLLGFKQNELDTILYVFLASLIFG
jgi:hypothetical protein